MQKYVSLATSAIQDLDKIKEIHRKKKYFQLLGLLLCLSPSLQAPHLPGLDLPGLLGPLGGLLQAVVDGGAAGGAGGAAGGAVGPAVVGTVPAVVTTPGRTCTICVLH